MLFIQAFSTDRGIWGLFVHSCKFLQIYSLFPPTAQKGYFRLDFKENNLVGLQYFGVNFIEMERIVQFPHWYFRLAYDSDSTRDLRRHRDCVVVLRPRQSCRGSLTDNLLSGPGLLSVNDIVRTMFVCRHLSSQLLSLTIPSASPNILFIRIVTAAYK